MNDRRMCELSNEEIQQVAGGTSALITIAKTLVNLEASGAIGDGS